MSDDRTSKKLVLREGYKGAGPWDRATIETEDGHWVFATINRDMPDWREIAEKLLATPEPKKAEAEAREANVRADQIAQDWILGRNVISNLIAAAERYPSANLESNADMAFALREARQYMDQKLQHAQPPVDVLAIVRERHNEISARLDKGKGTWPKEDYVRDEVWHSWQGERYALHSVMNEVERRTNLRSSPTKFSGDTK